MEKRRTPPILEARKISKSFPGVKALDEVSLTVPHGQVHALAGENGAGKSTLMNILSGSLAPDSGEFFIHGVPCRFRSPKDGEKAGIAIIHQELSLIPSMSVAENIFLGRAPLTALGNIHWKRLYTQAEALLSELDLKIDLKRPVESYPIGIQQMVEIAKALSLNASLIIMDEPTSSLSDSEAERLFEIIDRLKKSEHGIIYITHRLEEIYRISDRITVLRDGQHVSTDITERIPQDRLIHWMVGREMESFYKRDEIEPGEVVLEAKKITLPSLEGLTPLVDQVSFRLRAGEIVGIAGLLGSGSSELLGALFGRYGGRPSGTLRVKGRERKIRSPAATIREGFALLTNDRKASGLVMPLSVTRNMVLASLKKTARMGWITAGWERVMAEPYLDTLSIRVPSPDSEVWTLSGGNQQKVILAKWLMTEPSVILMDEPTRGIDVGAKAEIYRLMNALTAEGKAILLITSELPELLAMSDRILVMRQGKISGEFTRAEATPEMVMARAV